MIEWLIQEAAEDPQIAAGLPPEDLLSAPETAVYTALHSAKRRKDWLLGRWTAKRLVQAAADKSGGTFPSCSEISILAAKDGAPEVWFGEGSQLRRADFNISISHSREISLCAVVSYAPIQLATGTIRPAVHLLGADIETIAPRSLRFVEDYFTAEEKKLVRQTSIESRDCLITAIWSGKEAALKAVRQGLRLDTRMVSCRFPPPFQPYDAGQESLTWRPFTISWTGSQKRTDYPPLAGWWRVWREFILTLAVTAGPIHAEKRAGQQNRH